MPNTSSAPKLSQRATTSKTASSEKASSSTESMFSEKLSHLFDDGPSMEFVTGLVLGSMISAPLRFIVAVYLFVWICNYLSQIMSRMLNTDVSLSGAIAKGKNLFEDLKAAALG